jgi:hypothetical protein
MQITEISQPTIILIISYTLIENQFVCSKNCSTRLAALRISVKKKIREKKMPNNNPNSQSGFCSNEVQVTPLQYFITF